VLHDVGLNHLIGRKFPLKRWPEEFWQELHDKLTENNKTVSWQQGTNDIEDYIEWLHSCRIIVTNDSLGLHIALALGKPVVALFGPTIASEVDAENLVRITPPLDWSCIPCLESKCHQSIPCMNHISSEFVSENVLSLLTATQPITGVLA
jgi:heptosyltransferase-2